MCSKMGMEMNQQPYLHPGSRTEMGIVEAAQDAGMSAVSAPNSLVMANRSQWPHGRICTDRENLTCVFCHENIDYDVWLV